MAVALREAGLDDRELVRRLLADCLFEFDGRDRPHPEFDAYWAEPNRMPFLIESRGEVVGFCLIRVRDDGWSIAEFSVVPEQRRAGVGRAAVDVVAESARAAGAERLEAKVHPDNREALPFWIAIGFHEVSASGVVVTRRYLPPHDGGGVKRRSR
ncbi:MAG: GNAT family N-acetyltransferase [Candidatus Dormiibacterota bacterium]